LKFELKICHQGSKAYAAGLFKAGLVDQLECADICNALAAIEDEWRNETFEIHPSDEDIHSANERRLKVKNHRLDRAEMFFITARLIFIYYIISSSYFAFKRK
jgi:hypothetical protein